MPDYSSDESDTLPQELQIQYFAHSLPNGENSNFITSKHKF